MPDHAWIQAATEQLDRGPLTLTGAAASGVTSHAIALCDSLGQPQARLRVHGLTEQSDLIRELGEQVDAAIPGDPASVRQALARTPHVILVDDADLAPEPVRRLVETLPECRWVATGHSPVVGHALTIQAHEPFPLNLDDLPPGLELVAEMPVGVPEADPAVLADFRVPHPRRMILRRSVREALGVAALPTPEALEAVLRDRLSALHRLACDLGEHDVAELPLLRHAARTLPDDDLAALCGAAGARLTLRSFQASEAIALCQQVASARPLRPGSLAVLRWVEGDAQLFGGDEDAAHRCHDDAAELLLRAGATRARVTLARRCADAWAARNAVEEAHRWLAMARRDLARRADPLAMADILRIHADLAAGAGELVGAGALYEEASVTLAQASGPTQAVRTAIQVGRMGLAIRGADNARAEALLEGPEPNSPALAWRHAEVCTRLQRLPVARAHLSTARAGFRAAGSTHGLMLCARAMGDLEALSGDRLAAVAAWRQAASLCVRSRDLRGLQRVLERWSVVEHEGRGGAWVADLDDLRDTAATLVALADG